MLDIETGDRFIPFAALKEKGIGYTHVHIRRLVKKGQFPQPRRLSANRIAWLERQIEEWIQSRPAAEPKASPPPVEVVRPADHGGTRRRRAPRSRSAKTARAGR